MKHSSSYGSDSDSDEDDIILKNFKPSSKRKLNQAKKKVTKGFNILEEALNHAEGRQKAEDKITILKSKQQESEDCIMAKVEETIQQQQKQQDPSSTTGATGANNLAVKKKKRDSALAMGMVEDLENILGDKRCILLGKARDEDLSIVCGVRSIVQYNPKRILHHHEQQQQQQQQQQQDCFVMMISSTPTAATAATTYIRQLKEILRKLVSPNNKKLQMAWIQPMRKHTTRNNTMEFRYFLEQCQLCKLRQEHDLVQVPKEILFWLLNVATSSNHSSYDQQNDESKQQQQQQDTIMIRNGCMETLQGLLRQNKSMNAPSFLSLSQLAIQLEVWVPFLTTASTAATITNTTTATNAMTTVTSRSSITKDGEEEKSGPTTRNTRKTAATSTTTTTKTDENHMNYKDGNNSRSKDYASGLERLFIIWNTAFEVDQVSICHHHHLQQQQQQQQPEKEDGSNDRQKEEQEEAMLKQATKCLVLLAKMSLDVSFHSTEINHRLVKHMKCIVGNILNLVRQLLLSGNDSDDDGTNKLIMAWMKDTTRAILEELKATNLGPGDNEESDAKDPQAWLCYSLLCRIWPHMRRNHTRKTDCQSHKTISQFKALLCLEVLQHFFAPASSADSTATTTSSSSSNNNNKWDQQVFQSLVDYHGNNKHKCNLVPNAKGSLHWLVLCSSLVALLKVNGLGRAGLEDDKAKCLAIVEVALGRCLDVGMELFKVADLDERKQHTSSCSTSENNNDNTPIKERYIRNNEYKSAIEARDVGRLLRFLKNQCTVLESRMNAMSSHFRRVGYLVQCQMKYIHAEIDHAAFLGGERKIVQQGLDGWLKRGQKEEISQSDDDDGEEDEDKESPTKKLRTVLSEKKEVNVKA